MTKFRMPWWYPLRSPSRLPLLQRWHCALIMLVVGKRPVKLNMPAPDEPLIGALCLNNALLFEDGPMRLFENYSDDGPVLWVRAYDPPKYRPCGEIRRARRIRAAVLALIATIALLAFVVPQVLR